MWIAFSDLDSNSVHTARLKRKRNIALQYTPKDYKYIPDRLTIKTNANFKLTTFEYQYYTKLFTDCTPGRTCLQWILLAGNQYFVLTSTTTNTPTCSHFLVPFSMMFRNLSHKHSLEITSRQERDQGALDNNRK